MSNGKYHRTKRRGGFSLVELLVVVAIIVLLISMLVPALEIALGVAQGAACLSNLRNTAKAGLDFSRDNKGSLPGAIYFNDVPEGTPNKAAHDSAAPEPYMSSWLGYEVGWRGNEGIVYFKQPGWVGVGTGGVSSDAGAGEQPQGGTERWHAYQPGTLVPYINGWDLARKLYRCPSTEIGGLFSGVGSNGLFDYVQVAPFSGAKIRQLPATSQAQLQSRPGGPWAWSSMVTPIWVEEDPQDSINNCCPDSGWGNVDRLARNHDTGGQYAGQDGSAHRIEFGPGKPAARYDIKTTAPSGTTVYVGNIDYYQFNAWSKR